MKKVFINGILIGDAPGNLCAGILSAEVIDVKEIKDLPGLLEISRADFVALIREMKKHKKILAIKLVHKAAWWGLKESKMFVDSL